MYAGNPRLLSRYSEGMTEE